MKRNYETVFILTPILSEQQTKDTVDKFREVLLRNGAEIYHEETWGVKKLAYPVNKKTTGYYQLFEFKAEPKIVAALETEFKRDERVIRHLVVSLDKHAVEYNEKRRNKSSEPLTPKEA